MFALKKFLNTFKSKFAHLKKIWERRKIKHEKTGSFRTFGVSLVGSVPWGTHLCQFYESKQDLIDILVPYFAEGLNSNEFCMWITSPPLEVEEAREALQKAVPDLDEYFKKGQIEVTSYNNWYMLDGKFDSNRVLQGWVEKEKTALKRGFEGMRVTGNTFWVEREFWNSFVDYEEAVKSLIGQYRMLALCTYCLKNCNDTDVLDAVRNHAGTLIKQGRKWSLIEDATQRKKAEDAIRKSEQRYRSYIEVTGELGWTTNADGEIVEDIPSWRNFTGQTFEEAKGSGWSKALHPDDLAKTLKTWKRATQEKSKYEVEYRIRRNDGVYRYFMTRGVPVFKEDGSIREWVGTCIDITVRKQMEKKLEEYSKHLEQVVEERTKQLRDSERLAAIGATAGMVGHDIRNPLQAIIGDTFLAKTDLSSCPESEQKASVQESLSEIEKNVEYINKIVADLQDFAKPLNPIAKETDLKSIIDNVVGNHRIPENIQASIKVEKDVEKIVADSAYVQRILSNLVNNAVQAMPNGGKLIVQAFCEGKNNIITVEDTGVGIPEEAKRKLFTPLFTTKSKGQGFGLAVVKRMTEALGGTVTFDSQVDKGTKFIVRLPKKTNGKQVVK